MCDNYVVYHLHDSTSNCNGFADSCTSFDEYIKLAKKSGMKAIAFSNHGGIYDWVKKKQYCDKSGIKYIHGVELYLCNKYEDNNRGWHIGLYAKNLDGVKELNTIMSMATSKGSLEDKSDRRFYFNPRISMNDLFNTSSNIIITTACLASPLWKLSKEVEGENGESITKENIEVRDKFLLWMSNNSDRCFLEIQYHKCKHQIEFNKMLYEWSLKYNIPLIAGTDTHSSTKYKDECRTVLQKAKDSYYGEEDEFDLTWKLYNELVECFKEQDSLPLEVVLKAINNTNTLADMVEDFKLDKTFKYPDLYGDNPSDVWKELINSKLKEKLKRGEIKKENLSEYNSHIKEEFEAMCKQGMQSFMIFMSELMTWCRKNDIHSSPCRGSVGGSYIAYITDITDVDPFIWKTVFSRFCNADRISLADIDQDFAPEDRPKVYQYIIDRFGNKNVSYILTFQTIQDRGSIDTLAKGLGYSDLKKVEEIKNTFDNTMFEYAKIVNNYIGDLKELSEVEDLTSTSVNFDDCNIYARRIPKEKDSKELLRLKSVWDNLRKENKELFYYFDGIKGTIVSKGNHAAGMIGSPITLFDNLGVFYKNGDENFPVSTCSMKAVDSLNYVKFDILGLKTMGIIQEAFRLAGEEYKYAYQMNWCDDNIWNDMVKCNSGVFQFEGKYAHDLLKTMINSMNTKQMKPTVNHMSMVNAALRPSGKSYRDDLVGGKINKNPSSEIDKLLDSNNGYLIFQEDTIKFLTDICGFSGSLADTTRRAIGKKDIVLLNEQLPKILDGYCNKSSKERRFAEEEAKSFIQIISDSSDYQFGYNHSTGYSMVGYNSCYLRTYHTIEFVTAYLNYAENEDDYENGNKMIEEYGFKLKNIQFRHSKGKYFFNRETNSIYKGIGSIKFLNNAIGDELYELGKNSYNNFVELLSDISEKTSINSRQLDILIKVGFFNEFGSIKKLLKITEVFNAWHGKKTISKSKIKELGLKDIDLSKFGDDKSEKTGKELATHKNLKWFELVFELVKNVSDSEFGLAQLIKFQLDNLGYIYYTNKEIDKRYVVVTNIDTKYSPKFIGYCINNGKSIELKIHNKSKRKNKEIKTYFQDCPLENGDVIFMKTAKKENKKKNVDGEFIPIEGQYEWWIKDYIKVKL